MKEIRKHTKFYRFLKEEHIYTKFFKDEIIIRFRIKTLKGLNLLLEKLDFPMDDSLIVQSLRAEKFLADRNTMFVQFSVFMHNGKPEIWFISPFHKVEGTWEELTNNFNDFAKDVKYSLRYIIRKPNNE